MIDNQCALLEILEHLDPSRLEYQDWLSVGMALKDAGYSVRVWDDWSRSDSKRYHQGECERKWTGFLGSSTPVTAGTIVQLAKDQGWRGSFNPEDGHELDWDAAIGGKDDLIVLDKGWLEDKEVNEPAEWDPVRELTTYLELLFEASENVGYVTESYKKDEKFVPANKGAWDRTAGQLIHLLNQCGGDIGRVIGDYNSEAGAWIRFNPLDGKGIKNENVSEYRYALVESDNMDLEKTSLAKAIAQSYAQKGYEVKQTSELDGDNGAISFLNSYTDDKRLLLLEDPFGSVQLKPDKVESVQKIRKLITEKISFDRKIIITTRKDILFSAFDIMTLDDCSIDNNCWWDQTIKDVDFAHTFWNKLYGCEKESAEYFEKIKSWIEVKEAGVFLEIGEISNLKRLYNSHNELEKLNIEKVILDARISAKTIIDKVKIGGADSVKAFLTLGFCCNTIRSVFLDDLAYVLSSDNETPALIRREKNSIRCVSMGGGTTKFPHFPQYSQKHKIESNILSWLQQFEKQGYIFRNKLSKEICFAHPIFYYASKLLLLNELKNQWDCDETILLGAHALGALNKNVNLCALDTLWYCIENNCNFQENVLALILNSLNSIFPATKDKAVILLERHFQKLSVEHQEVLVKSIKGYDFDKYLLWHKNEPFINPNDKIELEWSFKSLFKAASQISLEEIKMIKSRQAASPQLIYDILNSTIADDLPLDFLNTSLTYDESIIREKAIYLIFKNHGSCLNSIGIYFINFDNCNVIFSLFRGALESWFDFTSYNRKTIVDYFLLHLQRISV